jgi:mono/diheme cytochrome c family protein
MIRSATSPARRGSPIALGVLLVACAGVRPAGAADESSLRLANAPGIELVTARCVVCHSVDYIVMNAPVQGRAGWEATVTKMIKVMQAPITPEEAASIVAYLDARYGAPPAAPRP